MIRWKTTRATVQAAFRGRVDEKTEALIGKLDEFIDENGMKYSTLLEAL